MKIVEAKLNGQELDLKINLSRLDAASAPSFKQECEEVWRSGIAAVRVELAQVQFIDSSGVGALLSLYKRLPTPNPTVKLASVQPTVQAVIELLRLHRIFEIEA